MTAKISSMLVTKIVNNKNFGGIMSTVNSIIKEGEAGLSTINNCKEVLLKNAEKVPDMNTFSQVASVTSNLL